MFKKLMSFLFEEEEIVEEIHTKPVEIKPIVPVEKIKEDPKSEIPVLDKPKSIFVDFDESNKQSEPDPVKKPEATKIIKDTPNPIVKTKKRNTEPMEYEFSSSISPIFGRKEEKEKQVITVQPKIELETSQSILGTIISPIYGIKNGNKITKRPEKVVPVSTNMSLEDILGVGINKDETITQLSLDQQEEIKPQEKDDILMQLFEEDND